MRATAVRITAGSIPATSAAHSSRVPAKRFIVVRRACPDRCSQCCLLLTCLACCQEALQLTRLQQEQVLALHTVWQQAVTSAQQDADAILRQPAALGKIASVRPRCE